MDGGDFYWLTVVLIPIVMLGVPLFFIFRAVNANEKSKMRTAEIEAQILLTTNNYDRIEKWLLQQERYLSDETVKKLIDKIAELKTNDILLEEFDSKLRVSADKVETLHDPSFNFGRTLIERESKKR